MKHTFNRTKTAGIWLLCLIAYSNIFAQDLKKPEVLNPDSKFKIHTSSKNNEYKINISTKVTDMTDAEYLDVTFIMKRGFMKDSYKINAIISRDGKKSEVDYNGFKYMDETPSHEMPGYVANMPFGDFTILAEITNEQKDQNFQSMSNYQSSSKSKGPKVVYFTVISDNETLKLKKHLQ